jgi:hypothetical protein
MKIFSAFGLAFLLSLSPMTFADDKPAAKDPAANTDIAVDHSHTDLKTEKMENKFDVSKVMKACMKEHNDKQLCSTNAMAECTKSMSKTDCRKAVKSAKK